MKIINLENAKKQFIKYVDNYDLGIEMIELKKNHSLRVMEISTKIAQEEKFNEEEIEIATLIGLLHDIARFRQYTEYHTFNDAESFDHGNMAVEILEKEDFIRNFIETDKYDEIIKLAIKNHNKFAIEEGLTNEQNKFCKIIRDADKIDILYIALEIFWKNEKEKVEKSIIDPKIKQYIDNRQLIKNSKNNKIEYVNSILRFLGFLYDINFKTSFKLILEENYIDRMINRFKYKDEYTQKEILEVGKQMNKYVLEKLK